MPTRKGKFVYKIFLYQSVIIQASTLNLFYRFFIFFSQCFLLIGNRKVQILFVTCFSFFN